MRLVNGTALDVKTERELDDLLGSGAEAVSARSCFCFSKPCFPPSTGDRLLRR
jgi:hypothetical protein